MIDATGFVLKYWFTIPQIQTRNYESISAFVGFSNFVKKFLITQKPKHICFAFDESLGSCFRNIIFKDYKANRPTAPNELKIQLSLCREFLDILGIKNFASKEYEADDIIYTLCKKNSRNNIQNIVITNDKDLYQVISKKDIWWNLSNKKLSYDDIENILGFSLKYFTDFQALTGDSVDNIPGAPGIGKVTATFLIKKYKTIDEIFKNCEDLRSIDKSKYSRIADILIKNKKIIYMSKKLVTLNSIDDIEFSHTRASPDLDKLKNFFEKVGVNKNTIKVWNKFITCQ